MCSTSDGIEDMEHFLLLCPSFDLQRRDLLAGIVELLRPCVQIASLSNVALTQLLLYGDQDLSNDLNKNILELTLRFIHENGQVPTTKSLYVWCIINQFFFFFVLLACNVQ